MTGLEAIQRKITAGDGKGIEGNDVEVSDQSINEVTNMEIGEKESE